MSYRILITGSRDWEDEAALAFPLGLEVGLANALGKPPVLISGACPTGADALAERIFRQYGLPIEQHPADWEKWGKRAGYLRNKEMVDSDPQVCLAFIRNGSKGATMTRDLTLKAGIRTLVHLQNY